MFEHSFAVIGAVVIIIGVFFVIVAVSIWILEAPLRKEDRERRARYRREQ